MPSLLLSGRCEALCVRGGAALAHAAPVPAAGVTAVCFADAEYPSRVAFGYLSKLCEDFTQATGGRLAASDEDGCMDSAFPVRPLTRGRAALACLACSDTRAAAATGAPEASAAVPGPEPGRPAHAHHERARADQGAQRTGRARGAGGKLSPTVPRQVVLHDTIEAALERGQKIDTLIEKSNDLSGSSKMFYKTAKKQNQCCSYM